MHCVVSVVIYLDNSRKPDVYAVDPVELLSEADFDISVLRPTYEVHPEAKSAQRVWFN